MMSKMFKNVDYLDLGPGEEIRRKDGTWSKREDSLIERHEDGSYRIINDKGDCGYYSAEIYTVIYHSDGSHSIRKGKKIYHSDGSWSKIIITGKKKQYGRVLHSDGTCSQYRRKARTICEGCYLTTACIVAKNLPDNCEELTILRNFRDNYVRNRINGEEDIKHYYDVAPKIVSEIRNQVDGNERFFKLYEELVLPCVNYIKAGKFDEAYSLYKKITIGLEEELIAK